MGIPELTSAPYSARRQAARGMLPPAMLPVAFALLAICGTGPNLVLALLSVVVLVVGCALLWRPGEPAVLLVTFAFPWLQGSIAIYHANWLGLDVVDNAPFPGDVHAAIVMTLLGLLALALGMRLGAGRRRPADALASRQTAVLQPMERWFWAFALAWALSFVPLSFAWVMPGLTQPMLALAGFRWVLFFMLAFAYFAHAPGRRGLFLLAFLMELATGLGAFFADFRMVFVVTLLAGFATGLRMSAKALLGSSAFATTMVALAIVWTAVKVEFRSFVSGGVAAQVVTVDYWTRLSKLWELAASLNAEALFSATDQLLRRLTYVEFFSVVLVNVPASMPHTLGAILWDAIIRPFMPRLLFVDKDEIDDTVRTNLYTGGLAGSSEGTSISLGYIAEAYIDFGGYGMFVELAAIGFFYGLIYRVLLRWWRSQGLLGMAVATSVLTNVGAMENSFTKVFGGVVVSLLVAWVVIMFIPPRLAPWRVTSRR